jgi:hypothetical protein
MYFEDDGTIRPVKMLVKDNFSDGKSIAWKPYAGTLTVVDYQLSVQPGGPSNDGGLALLDTNFTDHVFEADIFLSAGVGDAALAFWVNASSVSVANYDKYRPGIAFDGYRAGISAENSLAFIAASQGNVTTVLGTAPAPAVTLTSQHRIKVRALSSGKIEMFLDNATDPVVEVALVDGLPAFGRNGVVTNQTSALYDNIAIEHA